MIIHINVILSEINKKIRIRNVHRKLNGCQIVRNERDIDVKFLNLASIACMYIDRQYTHHHERTHISNPCLQSHIHWPYTSIKLTKMRRMT